MSEQAVLKSINRHLRYVSEKVVAFALADEECDLERQGKVGSQITSQSSSDSVQRCRLLCWKTDIQILHRTLGYFNICLIWRLHDSYCKQISGLLN